MEINISKLVNWRFIYSTTFTLFGQLINAIVFFNQQYFELLGAYQKQLSYSIIIASIISLGSNKVILQNKQKIEESIQESLSIILLGISILSIIVLINNFDLTIIYLTSILIHLNLYAEKQRRKGKLLKYVTLMLLLKILLLIPLLIGPYSLIVQLSMIFSLIFYDLYQFKEIPKIPDWSSLKNRLKILSSDSLQSLIPQFLIILILGTLNAQQGNQFTISLKIFSIVVTGIGLTNPYLMYKLLQLKQNSLQMIKILTILVFFSGLVLTILSKSPLNKTMLEILKTENWYFVGILAVMAASSGPLGQYMVVNKLYTKYTFITATSSIPVLTGIILMTYSIIPKKVDLGIIMYASYFIFYSLQLLNFYRRNV